VSRKGSLGSRGDHNTSLRASATEGTVGPGKLADLLVDGGDPVAEPALLRDRDRIWLGLQGGEPVAGAALERVRPGRHSNRERDPCRISVSTRH
jgi:hypothetical protein